MPLAPRFAATGAPSPAHGNESRVPRGQAGAQDRLARRLCRCAKCTMHDVLRLQVTSHRQVYCQAPSM